MRPITLPQKLIVLVVVIVPFLATILALGLLWKRAVHWSDFALLAMMYTLVGLGVTAGFHRMLTHRSFRPHPIVKGILLVLGSMALERLGLAHDVYRIPLASRARRAPGRKDGVSGRTPAMSDEVPTHV